MADTPDYKYYATLTNSSTAPVRVVSGGTAKPFATLDLYDPLLLPWDSMVGGGSGTLTITLSSDAASLGVVTDPGRALPGTPYDLMVTNDPVAKTATITARTQGGPQSAGANAFPRDVFNRLLYTAPTLANGQDAIVYASVRFTGTVSTFPERPTPSRQTQSTVTLADPIKIEIDAPDPVTPPAPTPNTNLATIVNANPAPVTVASGGTVTPFSYVDVDDPFYTGPPGISGGGSGFITVTLTSSIPGLVGNVFDPGRPSEGINNAYDPTANVSSFRRTTYGGPRSAGANAQPDDVLDRLIYTAPTLADGTTAIVYATVSFTGSAYLDSDDTTLTPYTVTLPEPIQITVAGAPLPEAAPAVLPALPAPAPPVSFGVVNQSSGAVSGVAGGPYTGPVAGLERELLLITPDNLAVVSTVPNTFIHTGSGNDAIDVSAAGGANVLDGGAGSNFLTGGSGQDTFFVDARGAAQAMSGEPLGSTWSTVRNFGAGDAATLWGLTPQSFAMDWQDNQGAAGATGLTLAATAPGRPNVNLTLSGYSTADLSNGRLAMSFGSNGGGDYLYVRAA